MDDHTSAIPQTWKNKKNNNNKKINNKLIPISNLMNLIVKQRWAQVAIKQGIQG
jgi:hypothetical protein